MALLKCGLEMQQPVARSTLATRQCEPVDALEAISKRELSWYYSAVA
jgi:hypothetical protein